MYGLRRVIPAEIKNETLDYCEWKHGYRSEAMTGVSMDGKVCGVELLSINDTAGLGMNATKPDFRDQFVGLVNGIKVMKNSSDRNNNEITALTGATITSKAVTEGVNKAIALVKEAGINE